MSFGLISDEEFLRRLEFAKAHKKSNCVGTALYLAGMRDEDKGHCVFMCKRIFDLLDRMELPERGSLIVLKNNDYFYHAGVVTQTDPLTIIHRPGTERVMENYVSLAQFIGQFIKHGVDEFYYEPKRVLIY